MENRKNTENRDIKREKAQAGKKDKKCPVLGKCGGCKWLCEPYEKQLAVKEKHLKELCGKFVKFEKILNSDAPSKSADSCRLSGMDMKNDLAMITLYAEIADGRIYTSLLSRSPRFLMIR